MSACVYVCDGCVLYDCAVIRKRRGALSMVCRCRSRQMKNKIISMRVYILVSAIVYVCVYVGMGGCVCCYDCMIVL